MRKLVEQDGTIAFGIYDDVIGELNFGDYSLRTPMGLPVPGFLKSLKFNQFHFFGLMGPELMAGMAVVNLKLVTNGFFYLYDRGKKEVIETKKLALPGGKTCIRLNPAQVDSVFESGDFRISMKGNRMEAEGRNIRLEIETALEKTRPLRICTRAGYRGWVYTQKTSPIPVKGTIFCNGKTHAVASPEYMGLMDWTGGFMRKHTCWNWAATAATLKDGRTFGLNLACGVNETGFTENAFWLDGVMTKVDTVNFVFDSRDLYRPWRMASQDGKVELLFHPERERSEKIHVGLIASRFTQLMGTLEGRLTTDAGEQVRLDNCPAWAEDHYAKW
ncbi:MAG: DUF2804 domain-containing protein [Thermodesulfobacteriota bacterium]